MPRHVEHARAETATPCRSRARGGMFRNDALGPTSSHNFRATSTVPASVHGGITIGKSHRGAGSRAQDRGLGGHRAVSAALYSSTEATSRQGRGSIQSIG